MKIVTMVVTCDICKAECKGDISLYVSNDIKLDAQMKQTSVALEQHFCPLCTDKIKQFISEQSRQDKI